MPHGACRTNGQKPTDRRSHRLHTHVPSLDTGTPHRQCAVREGRDGANATQPGVAQPESPM
jgi:hypothetical protein